MTSALGRVLVLLGATFLAPLAIAEPSTLNVGTKVAPPFVIKDGQGTLSGISIELWQRIAQRLELRYQLEEADLRRLISGLQDGSLDVSVAALTTTPGREAQIDFSHPFYTTGYAIAVPRSGNSVWLAVKRFLSWEFFSALAALGAVLFLAGLLLWLAERRRNPEMFGGTKPEGIGASFWWAAVTMTTVGYGDKAPITFAGRLVALIWMFASIIIISSFTAAIATSLTVSHLQAGIDDLDDLRDARVATVAGSASAEFLNGLGIRYTDTATLNESLKALASDRADAVVYDAPIMRYLVQTQYRDQLRVLKSTFERQDYAFALPEGSPLREPINRELLQILRSDAWQDLLRKYLDP